MKSVWIRAAASLIGLVVFVAAVATVLTKTTFHFDDPLVQPAAVDVTSVRINPGNVYDPARAGEPLPPDYRQLLNRDQILPVYDPILTSASMADWPAEMLVIGVS